MIFTLENARIPAICRRADIEQLLTEELLALHNKLPGKGTTRFANRGKSLEQVWKALEAAGRAAQPPSASPVDGLLAVLSERPHNVAEIRELLSLPSDKKARNVIDRATPRSACR